MHNEHLLSLLGPASTRYEHQTDSCQRLSPCLVITGQDVAAALAMAKLPRPAYWFILAKYRQDSHAHGRIENFLSKLASHHQQHRGHACKSHQALGCARAALYCISCGRKCGECDGVGQVYNSKHAALCGLCGGSGLGQHTQRHLARIAQIPISTWQRHWVTVADYLIQTLHEFESLAMARLSRQV